MTKCPSELTEFLTAIAIIQTGRNQIFQKNDLIMDGGFKSLGVSNWILAQLNEVSLPIMQTKFDYGEIEKKKIS